MSVARVIEIISGSRKGFEDAIPTGIDHASKGVDLEVTLILDEAKQG